MKDPKAKHFGVDAEEFGTILICAEDGKEWPCKTWRKWAKSKDYRIAELERRVNALTLSIEGIYKKASDLHFAVHRNELLTAAQMEWLAGLNRTTGHAAGVETRHEVEEVDVTNMFEIKPRRIPGRESFEVRYGGGEWKS